jgi:hypothetical protein
MSERSSFSNRCECPFGVSFHRRLLIATQFERRGDCKNVGVCGRATSRIFTCLLAYLFGFVGCFLFYGK